MRIACPSCATEYEVPASRLPPQKMVRCARCGGEWMATREAVQNVPPPEAVASPDPPPGPIASLPAITAMDRLTASVPPRASPAGLTAAWISTAIVLVAAVAAIIAWRGDIMRAWPPSSRILAAGGQIMAPPAQTMGKKAE